MRRVTALLLLAGATLLVWGEVVHWRSSRRGVPGPGGAARREAIVVLGFGNRGPRINLVNRYRVRAALRSRSVGAESLLVLCGGAVTGSVPEADLLARHARALGYRGSVALDRESRSTWENVRNAIPYLEDADAIKIVSNSLHAEKARIYLARMRPDLAARLRRAEEHRFGELLLVKPFAAIRGLWELRGLGRFVAP